MCDKQISIFDLPIVETNEIIIDKTINENKLDKLVDLLTNPTLITDVKPIIEDLLKLVFAEEFNKQWNKHNYILRNIDKRRITDKGLHPIRSALTLTLPKDKETYQKGEMMALVTKVINNLIVTTEVGLMRQLCHQFRYIVTLDPSETFKAYRRMLTDITDQELLSAIMQNSETQLKNGLSIEVNSSWQWLTFGNDGQILTKTFETDSDDIYEAYIINNTTYAFDSKFIENILKTLDDARQISNIPGARRFKLHYEPMEFKDICCKKRQD